MNCTCSKKTPGRLCRSDYNSKLFNGLELVMLVDILVFRFFLRSSALETVGWLGFFFLQVLSVDLLPLTCHVLKQEAGEGNKSIVI